MSFIGCIKLAEVLKVQVVNAESHKSVVGSTKIVLYFSKRIAESGHALKTRE